VILGIISELVVLGFVIIVVTYGGGYIAMNAMSQMDSALPIPMGVVYLALPVSGVLSVFYALCNITDSIKKYKTL
jgi:TRAP-type C4-dicarboxylate transport system permease small subunit